MKKYNKEFNIQKTLFPKVFSLIPNIPDQYFYHEKHAIKLRHPGAILTRAAQEIFGSFTKIIEQWPNISSPTMFQPNSNKDMLDTVLREMEVLFGHMNSYYDECYMVLKCFCVPPSLEKSSQVKFVFEWLKANDFVCGSDFHSYAGNLHQFVTFFNNKLKHANQRLDPCAIMHSDTVVPGFYMSEVTGNDFSEVFLRIPQTHSKAVITFSINQTLKRLLLIFYQISDALERAIAKHLKNTYDIHISVKRHVMHTTDIEETVRFLADLGDYYYPYEYLRHAKVRTSGNTVKISFPHGDASPYGNRQLKTFSRANADGYTNTYPIPVY